LRRNFSVSSITRQGTARDHQRGADQSHTGTIDRQARNAPDRQRDQAPRKDYRGGEAAGIALEQAAGNHEREQTCGHRQRHDDQHQNPAEPENPLRPNPWQGTRARFGWRAYPNRFALHTPVNGGAGAGDRVDLYRLIKSQPNQPAARPISSKAPISAR
jgi:hypothetical protein